MDEFGVRIKNQNGFIQIDSNYQNMALLTKGATTAGTVYSNSGLNPSVWYYVDIAINMSEFGMLATRCGVRHFLLSTTRSGGTTIFRLLCENSSTPINWYAFDRGIAGSGEFGVKIKRPSDGGVAFDSNLPYMVVVGMLTGDLFNGPAHGDPAYSIGYASRGSIAVLSAMNCYSSSFSSFSDPSEPVQNWIGLFEVFTVATVGSTLSIENKRIATNQGSSGGVPPSSFCFSYAYLLVDVAGL